MPGLDQHEGSKYIKALYMGDPGAGKTGSLASLVAAGYELRIYDFDNLLSVLGQYVKKTCPDRLSSVKYQTFTDKVKGNDAPLQMVGSSMKVTQAIEGSADAFSRAMRQLNNWKTPTEDLGNPGTWGENCVVVIDTLTRLSDAAYRYVNAMNPAARDPQAVYHAAQQIIIGVLSRLYGENFATNVIVLAHINYVGNGEGQLVKGYPRSVGSALNGVIGSYFNCVLMAERQGSKRVIRTKPNGIVDLKNPVDFKVAETLPLETGLADFFKAFKS